MSNLTSADVSLERLVREFYAYVHRLALSILDDGNPGAAAEAEDAAQDVFLLAARAIPKFRGEASLKTWLTTISVNHCLSRLRKRRSRLRLLNRFGSREAEAQKPEGPEALLVVDHEKRTLWTAVDRLPDKQRIPILLFYVHDLSTAEIARTLGLPEGTVHSRLHHARLRLHMLMEDYDE